MPLEENLNSYKSEVGFMNVMNVKSDVLASILPFHSLFVPLSQTGPKPASKLQTRSSGSPTAAIKCPVDGLSVCPAMSLVKCSQERARAAGPTDGRKGENEEMAG